MPGKTSKKPPVSLKQVESRLKTLAIINRDKAAVCELGRNLVEREIRKHNESKRKLSKVIPSVIELAPELPMSQPKKLSGSIKSPCVACSQSRAQLTKPNVQVSCKEDAGSSESSIETREAKSSDYQPWIKSMMPLCSTVQGTESSTVGLHSQDSGPKHQKHSRSTSRVLKDSQHGTSQLMQKQKPNFNGPEWKRPCMISSTDLGGPRRKNVGAESIQKVSKISGIRQKFFLTQDPGRIDRSIPTKKTSHVRDHDTSMIKMVKEADNVCSGNEQTSQDSLVCEPIDLENPMNLDFQGMDYKNTYEVDEQFFENKRQYRRMARYLDRNRVKKEAAKAFEAEQLAARSKIPECFLIKDRNAVIQEPIPDPIRYGRLYRSEEKPLNKSRIEAEQARRRQRFKSLFQRKHEIVDEKRKDEQAAAAEAEKYKGALIAAKDFDETIAQIEDAVKHSFYKHIIMPPAKPQKRDYPHNLKKTRKFKKELKQEKRTIRDIARVKKEFYKDRLDKEKHYPEADLEVTSASSMGVGQEADGTVSDDTNDEDDMEVGPEGKCFKLRGLLYRGNNIRGKFHQNQFGNKSLLAEKTCQTRDEWLQELIPKKVPIKVDVAVGIDKYLNPDDPRLNLFGRKEGVYKPRVKYSAVRKFISQRLGKHYSRSIHRNLKITKPRLPYRIKKFNLIKFLYAQNDLELQKMRIEDHERDFIPQLVETTTSAYIQEKERKRKAEKEAKKAHRMQLLGLPCISKKRSSLLSHCSQSDDSSYSDWVPDPEPEVQGTLEQHELEERARLEESGGLKRLTLKEAGNMPAPLHRESTLRRHPRYPRDYENLRVPSAIFDQVVKETGVPHLQKLNENVMIYENVWQRNRLYMNLFGGRHHHDHWNPRQIQNVSVHYQPRIAKPDVLNTQDFKKCKTIYEQFVPANPPCKQYINDDLTLPRYDFESMIKENKMKRTKSSRDSHLNDVMDTCELKDFIFHSRSMESLDNEDFPGRRKYLEFLEETRKILYEEKEGNKADLEDGDQKLAIDKDEFIKELEEDLRSIESCLSSLSDSECTNLTNDSGSFLLMEGVTKVPLDYVRKPFVPFEEAQRRNLKAKPIGVNVEYANPFQLVPFPGQLKEQIAFTAPKDRFFTYSTRLNNGLRARLEVPIVDVKRKLIGRKGKKFRSAVTTDIDAKYIALLKERPAVKNFHFKTGRDLIKDALLMKFESMVIQGQVVRAKIYNRLNEKHWERMEKTKVLYEKLFAKWEKREYEATMAVVYQVKTFYEITDRLRLEARELDRQLNILNMDIVFSEGVLIRRIMLQNFHYLLADSKWRYEYDWMHRIEGTDELEGYEESIAKRPVVFIRPRDRDDAWAVKAFFESNYAKKKHPRRIVFPDVNSFMNGIENLKRKTFTLLLELHYTMSLHTELEGRVYNLKEWCSGELKNKDTYAQSKFSKHRFMDQRAKDLKACTYTFLDKPVEDSFNDPAFNKDRAVISEVWRQIVPPGMRGAGDEQMEPSEMVAMICDVVMQLIGDLETMPTEKIRKVEAAVRRRNERLRKISAYAYQLESRIKAEVKNIQRNLAPPYQKPRFRVGKLPRHHLKKKVIKEVKTERHISEHTKFFFRAFHDEGDVLHLVDARDSLDDVDKMQENIVPFYFDHFLKLNGYTANYNFKTQIEIRDGNELERFKVKRLIPEVLEKVETWEKQRRRIMDENIAKNPQMYENVNI